jgi:hypothetical protein
MLYYRVLCCTCCFAVRTTVVFTVSITVVCCIVAVGTSVAFYFHFIIICSCGVYAFAYGTVLIRFGNRMPGSTHLFSFYSYVLSRVYCYHCT